MLEQVMEKMSKIIKIIERLNQNEPNSIGFGSNNNIGQYDLDFDNETVKSSISLKYWEYNPLGYNIAAPAIGLKITSRGKMT